MELKSGETYNGHLVNVDSWMNIHLREVICTSKVRGWLAVRLLACACATGRATTAHGSACVPVGACRPSAAVMACVAPAA